MRSSSEESSRSRGRRDDEVQNMRSSSEESSRSRGRRDDEEEEESKKPEAAAAGGDQEKEQDASKKAEVVRKNYLCNFWQRGKCNRGAQCGWAHGNSEIGGHVRDPQGLKVVLCR